MSVKYLKWLFVSLMFAASMLVGIKLFGIYVYFIKNNPAPLVFENNNNQEYAELLQLNNELEIRKQEIENKIEILNALSLEIDDKLETLQQAGNNLLQLIKSQNNGQQNEASVTTDEETQTVIIEIGNVNE